jgi:hypothetical protein
MSELKPCPLCDGVAQLSSAGFGYFTIHCEACHLVAPGKPRDQAIAAWNTRTQPLLSGDVELREALRWAEVEWERARNALTSSTYHGRARTEEAEREVKRLRQALSRPEGGKEAAGEGGGSESAARPR